jgi:hypothetical protein
MDQLSAPNITTRPLDTFESESLERLRRDEDIVIEATSNGCRMLGSLRARAKCLECHSVERGELLGAFSYQFGPK